MVNYEFRAVIKIMLNEYYQEMMITVVDSSLYANLNNNKQASVLCGKKMLTRAANIFDI